MVLINYTKDLHQPLSAGAIEKQVNEFLKQIKYKSYTDFINIFAIADDLGFSICTSNLNDTDAFIIINPNNPDILRLNSSKVIGVNSNKTLEEKKYLVARQIAYYILYYDTENKNGLLTYKDTEYTRDINATRFARELISKEASDNIENI